MIHLLVIPDNVVLPASIHQFLIVNRENGEPGRVFIMGGYRDTKLKSQSMKQKVILTLKKMGGECIARKFSKC